MASDRNAAERAERTLRTWKIPDKEIQVVHEEADKILERGGAHDRKKEELWARSEIVAPSTGTVVERNVVKGEFIADTTNNLFVIANVNRLLVRASTPEDDLPLLLKLEPAERVWKIQAVGLLEQQNRPPLTRSVRLSTPISTRPSSRATSPTPAVGCAGQYVTATVELPPPPDVVEVPVSAVVDDHVFVQDDPTKQQFPFGVCWSRTVRQDRLRQERTHGQGSKLTKDKRDRELLPRQPLLKGERVLTAGVLELKARLGELKSSER